MTYNYKWMVRTALFAGTVSLAILMAGCKATTQSRAGKMNAGMSGGNAVRLEHVAINVADPIKMAQWYANNLGMKVMREGPPPTNMRFIADRGGNMMLELYHNPPDAVPNYAAMDPLLLHVAFMVDDVDAVRQKLLAAGATPAGEVTTTPAGDKLAMLRDPWGLAIQLLRRADPMLPAAQPSPRR
jgi:glyoxylase I family protein